MALPQFDEIPMKKRTQMRSTQMNYSRQYPHPVVTSGHFEKGGLKQKAVHELTQFIAIFLYLAFFFCAVTTYRMLLQSDFRDSYISYSFSVINALVVAKVILIGEYGHLGKRLENKPLLLSSYIQSRSIQPVDFCVSYCRGRHQKITAWRTCSQRFSRHSLQGPTRPQPRCVLYLHSFVCLP